MLKCLVRTCRKVTALMVEWPRWFNHVCAQADKMCQSKNSYKILAPRALPVSTRQLKWLSVATRWSQSGIWATFNELFLQHQLLQLLHQVVSSSLRCTRLKRFCPQVHLIASCSPMRERPLECDCQQNALGNSRWPWVVGVADEERMLNAVSSAAEAEKKVNH